MPQPIIAAVTSAGPARTTCSSPANLEIASLAAAIEFEDRNQIMLGFTENLPEAIRAFAANRPPVYTDEPRKDLFDGGWPARLLNRIRSSAGFIRSTDRLHSVMITRPSPVGTAIPVPPFERSAGVPSHRAKSDR